MGTCFGGTVDTRNIWLQNVWLDICRPRTRCTVQPFSPTNCEYSPSEREGGIFERTLGVFYCSACPDRLAAVQQLHEGSGSAIASNNYVFSYPYVPVFTF